MAYGVVSSSYLQSLGECRNNHDGSLNDHKANYHEEVSCELLGKKEMLCAVGGLEEEENRVVV